MRIRNAKELRLDLKNAEKGAIVSKIHLLEIKLGTRKSNLSQRSIDNDLLLLEGRLQAYSHAIEMAEALLMQDECEDEDGCEDGDGDGCEDDPSCYPVSPIEALQYWEDQARVTKNLIDR